MNQKLLRSFNFTLFIFLFILSQSLISQELLSVNKIDHSEIQIDGDLSENAWSNAKVLPIGFEVEPAKEVTGEDYIAPNQQGSRKDKKKKKDAEKTTKENATPKKENQQKEQKPKKQEVPVKKTVTKDPSAALKTLDSQLVSASYLGGWVPSVKDASKYTELSDVDCSKFASLQRWKTHIASFEPAVRATWS